MTTKPKARKFRIKKRNAPTAGSAAASSTQAPSTGAAPQPTAVPTQAEGGSAADQLRMARQPDAAQTQRAAPQAQQPKRATSQAQQPQPAGTQKVQAGEVASAAQVAGDTDMDAIRHEGLTGRQLRMARRVAQKHGLAPTSDFDAVRLLREKGIDPFQRSNMLELVVPQAGGEQREGGAPDAFSQLPAQAAGAGKVQLPQTIPTGQQTLPSTDISPAERRTREISDIQRDISRRRRKKMGLLLVRLAFFVMLPTLFAGYYFYTVATPMYATKSEFMITSADNAGGSGLGSLLTGTPIASSSDSIATQGYLQSKEAMLKLDQDDGFKDHFTDEGIDAIQRLTPDPSNEEAYKLYKKFVKIGYDPTEGIVRMEVVAADPNTARRFSERLVSYAEERLNGVSLQQRENQMRDALASFEVAERERRAAQEALLELQVESSTVDPENVLAALRSNITNYETILLEKELELSALLDNQRPNRAKVEGVQGDIRRLNQTLEKLESRMNVAKEGENSLAQRVIELQLAQADLASRDLMMQSALQQVEQTRMEASRQVRYLNLTVSPLASEEASYPRSFENTILAFLIFAGIYLMISLTASILREQVTS